MSTEILIVEDDEAIAAGLALNLRIDGYEPVTASDAEAAMTTLAARSPALVLLDISLPGKSGLELLAELRRAGDLTPVIVLSARRDEFDKVAALRLGADDYVTKPFALAELLARVAAVLRRGRAIVPPVRASSDPEESRFGDVVVDHGTRVVTRGGSEVKLTHLEFELLRWFLTHPTQVFTREELIRSVWGMAAGSRRSVDNFVAQLRAKLELDAEAPRHFVTVRGSGYRFDP
jgi:two-component system, OmpR family, alkaline phosphatase synthesis response regulator PhoP